MKASVIFVPLITGFAFHCACVAGEPGAALSLPEQVRAASHIFIATASAITPVKTTQGVTVEAEVEIVETLFPHDWDARKITHLELHFRNQDPATLQTELVGHKMIYILTQAWSGSRVLTGAPDSNQIAVPIARRKEVEAELAKRAAEPAK